MLNSTNLGTPPLNSTSGRLEINSSDVSGSSSSSSRIRPGGTPSARRSSPAVPARRRQACRISSAIRTDSSCSAAHLVVVMITGRSGRQNSL